VFGKNFQVLHQIRLVPNTHLTNCGTLAPIRTGRLVLALLEWRDSGNIRQSRYLAHPDTERFGQYSSSWRQCRIGD